MRACICLAILTLLQCVRSQTTGYLKITATDNKLKVKMDEDFQYQQNFKVKEDGAEGPSSAGSKICLGRKGHTGYGWNVCSCGVLPNLLTEGRWSTDNGEDAVYVPISHKKVSTHLIILTNEEILEDELERSDCDATIGTLPDTQMTPLPLMLPRDDVTHKLETLSGRKLNVSLICVENYFGPRCDVFCDSSKESFTCNPQTGEASCNPGWIGPGCDENVFIDKETASQFIKSRPRRSEGLGVCSERKCTKEELRTEFLLRDDVLTEEYWDIYNDANDCENNPCDVNGTLSCEDLYQKYTCHCKPGFKGANCSEIDLCHLNLCMNGGVCQDISVTDFSSGENSLCQCPNGFQGVLCEVKNDPCLDNPCGYYGECALTADGFRCVCDVGFTGATCDVNIDDCADDPCMNGGECIDGRNFYECLCEVGYHGKKCEKLSNPCNSDPCMNGGECVDEEDGYHSCICPENFEGPSCMDAVENPCDGDPCNGRGECYPMLEEEDGSEYTYEQSVFCACEVGYIGKHCETQVSACEAVEFPCPYNATCVSLEGEYICVCPAGYEGKNCDLQCDPCEERNDIMCKENPCLNGARCLLVGESTTCVCSPGFSGLRCEVKINFCDDEPCASGECVSMVDGYLCDCQEGFIGTDCDEDINECEVEYGLCKNNASCDNTFGGFECLCNEEYTGKHCEHKINPCFSDPCLNGGSCWGSGESFTCFCKIGYVGPTCEEMVDLCADESSCLNNGICEIVSPEEQAIKCTCGDRFYGAQCEREIPACMVKYEDSDGKHKLTERDDCGSYGVCVADGHSFKCDCKEGYIGEYCDQRVNVIECEDVHCKCETALRNFKALHNKVNNATECNHSLYGKGRCTRETCLLHPCTEPKPLTCNYVTECFDDGTSATLAGGNDTAWSCQTLHLYLASSKLPESLTLNDICDKIRDIPAFQRYENDTVINCHLNDIGTSGLEIAAAVQSKTSKFNAKMVAIELFQAMEERIISSMNTEAGNGTEQYIILDSLKNASFEGRFVRYIYPQDGDKGPVDINPEKNSNDIIIAAVVAAVALVLLIIVLVVIFCTRRKKSTQRGSPRHTHMDNNNIPAGYVKWTKKGQDSEDKFPTSYDNPLVFGVEDNAANSSEENNIQSERTQPYGAQVNDTSRQGVSTFISPNRAIYNNSVNSATSR